MNTNSNMSNYLLIAAIGVVAIGIIYFQFGTNKAGITTSADEIRGTVIAVDENSITVKGQLEEADGVDAGEDVTATFLITPDTQFIKTILLINIDVEHTEPYTPESRKEVGSLVDMKADKTFVDLKTTGNILKDKKLTAESLSYMTSEFFHGGK